MAKTKVDPIENDEQLDTYSDDTKDKLKDKSDNEIGLNLGAIKGESYTEESLSEDEKKEIIEVTMKELKKSEDALADDIAESANVKKAYLDKGNNRDDPFYIDYNLLFNNVDMLMALTYSNEMKAIFVGTQSTDNNNSNIITKTAEYDNREEMDMEMVTYELGIDKYIDGVGTVIWEWNEERNAPSPKVGPAEYFRPDPNGRGHPDRYRFMGWHGKMTKAEMRSTGSFFDVDNIIDTQWNTKDSSDMNDNGSNVTISPDDTNDESALYAVYNHMRTNKEGKKCLVTLANSGSLLVRYIEMDYEIGGKPVFPVSLNFWKPKKGYPKGIKLYDLTNRKQKVLSLVLNLAVKKAVRSSLGNHLIVDDEAVKNKAQLRQLTEFPELILFDSNNGAKNAGQVITELQRSQVPQDNYNIEERIKQLNYEETSIGPNQLGISPTGDQTATEIKDNAANSNVRLSLANRIEMNFWKDFWRKWLMMYNYHFPKDAKKQVTISREFGDKYLTFEHKYLNMSGDPHIKIASKFDLEQKNKQQFANHVVLHSYIEKISMMPQVPMEVRLSLRKALRLLGYDDDEINDYVKESAEEEAAKQNLFMLNRNEKLEPLTPEQINENHEEYIKVYKQAIENDATRAALRDRINYRLKRDMLRQQQMQVQQQPTNTNGMQNQMTANMINQDNSGKQPSLMDIKM